MRRLEISRRNPLPLAPLLHAYCARGVPTIVGLLRLPTLGPRFTAILGASARFLHPEFLDRASESQFRDAVVRFYESVVTPPLHAETLRRRAGFVRHALTYLMHGNDPLPGKLDACLSAKGTYRVPGLGPSFWSALIQGLAPARSPAWTTATRAGMDRLASDPETTASAQSTYAALIGVHEQIRRLAPELTSFHVDHFLTLVSRMVGRDLFRQTSAPYSSVEDVPSLATLGSSVGDVPSPRHRGSSVGDVPSPRHPWALHRSGSLRERLKERGLALAEGQRKLEAAQGNQLASALALADPLSASRSRIDWQRQGDVLLDWARRLWSCDDPFPLLDEIWSSESLASAGLWWPAAVLHLRDPQRFLPFSDPLRRGIAKLDDGSDPADSPAERYRLLDEAAEWLRHQHGLHPLELPDVIAAADVPLARTDGFEGFCTDTFAFLAELSRENRRAWMEQERERYVWAVRQPLTELCQSLASRYVEPILGGIHGWQLDTSSRTGRALTSICKNNYGRSAPYNSTVWITFCRSGREGAQLFVRVDPEGVCCGLRLGRGASDDRRRLRTNVDRYAETISEMLQRNGAAAACRLDDLLSWAREHSPEACVTFTRDDPVLITDELVERTSILFDQLLPLFAACVEDDAGDALRRLGAEVVSAGYSARDFSRQAFLDEPWLHQAQELLSLKKQLILQGVPGTGKTHVARCLARLLTGGNDDAVRLVQFHPAFSYEEFVEGIRVRSVDVDGRHDVTYPVEDGLLCSFAALAESKPSQPHVLIVDEINRGNLPRIFGELLYLLEYRGQKVELPYSRRAFRLPSNLYLIGTMNVVDRSLSRVDQALRRRFSFLQMEPNPAILESWLRLHPPTGCPSFATRVLSLFERLNAKIASEVGSHARLGHSFFMVQNLDEDRLRLVWRHHVRPWLEEIFTGQPDRIISYDALLESRTRRGDTVSCP